MEVDGKLSHNSLSICLFVSVFIFLPVYLQNYYLSLAGGVSKLGFVTLDLP